MINALRFSAFVFALSFGSLWAGGDGWMQDYKAAEKLAEREGKDVLIYFTNSDRCGWCIKLDKEVFSQDVFKRNAARDFVFVIVDNPRQSPLPADIENQNQLLRKHYSVAFCPTVLLCDAQGRPYAKTGYRTGGAERYLKHVNRLMSQKAQRDAGIAEAADLQGPPKARALEKALSVVPSSCFMIYKDELAAIAAADPDDASGFTAKMKASETAKALKRSIQPLFKDRDFAGVSVCVDAYIKEQNPTGEALQTAMLYQLQALYKEKKFDQAIELAEKVIAINETNRPARFSRMLKKRIQGIQGK
ncbi:MAG: thioredoxin family protein [Verrucomicrobiae bacterium]|nr:thioredoxin family protein [Verrucomicrobiae bacterium]NNJ42555.1 thioredoxin fold domain-containing protein [Akkermansiaceae bacterium]